MQVDLCKLLQSCESRVC